MMCCIIVGTILSRGNTCEAGQCTWKNDLMSKLLANTWELCNHCDDLTSRVHLVMSSVRFSVMCCRMITLFVWPGLHIHPKPLCTNIA